MSGGDASDHLVDLPGGNWKIWRTTCLRGAGLPASLVLKLAASDAAAAADRCLELETLATAARRRAVDALRSVEETATGDAVAALRKAGKVARKGRPPADTGTAADEDIRAFRAAYDSAEAARAELKTIFEDSRARVFRAAQDVVSDPLLREAVLWQNRAALDTAFGPFVRADATTRGSKARQQEKLVASYLQRYCTKNDSIGFFGPIGWGRFADDAEPIAIRPGKTLTAARKVYFEQWAIDLFASKLASDPRMEPWLVPRRLPFVRLDGGSAVSAESGRHALTPEQAKVLASSDGRRSARDLSRAIDADEEQVLGVLRFLREKRLIAWTFELPLAMDPDDTLRKVLAHVGDDALRDEALASLAVLDDARRAINESAGNLEKLPGALAGLDDTFVRLTGSAATRSAGSMYAARQVVYEDCRRDVDLVLGPAVLDAFGPALSLVLASARWLSTEIAKECGTAVEGLYADLLRRSKDGVVRFSDLWLRAPRVFLGAKRPADACIEKFADVWTSLLALPEGATRVQRTVAELGPQIRDVFAASGPGWIGARQHSPDLMLVAPSVDAIARGEFEVVLGEIHVGGNTLTSTCFYAQHPDPQELQKSFARDFPEPLILPVFSKDFPKVTVRTNRALMTPWSWKLETGMDPASADRDHVIGMSDLVVENRNGALMVSGGALPPTPLMAFFADSMTANVMMGGVRFLKKGAHTPRVTIDRLVICRESWMFTPSELPFADEKDEGARFFATRRWAHAQGLPRFFFVKSELEVKPQFVDLDSPVFLSIFTNVVRRARDHVSGETRLSVTEMLPGLDQTWLPDAKGEHYTSELRIVVVDPARGAE